MSVSFFNSFNGNSNRLGQNYAIQSYDVAEPKAITFISSDASSITFSFTPPTTSGTISGYRFSVNGQPVTGYGTPSAYTINGLSPGQQYSINLVANIVATGSASTTITGTFNPTSITGCSVWWDGADPNGTGVLPANGASINTWADKSGNGYNATATGAATYSLSGKSLTFNGGYYTSNYPANPTYETCFIVYNVTSTNGNGMFMVGSVVGGREIFVDTTPTRVAMGNSYVSRGTVATGVGTIGQSYLVVGQINNGPSNNYISVNGALTLNGPAAMGSSFTAGTTTDLGVENRNGGFFYGNLMEILFYNSVLSATDRQKVEGYLAWKWSMQSKLPSGHPYYSTNGYTTSTTNTITTYKNIVSNPSRLLTNTTLAPFPTNIQLISATTTSLTFSFTAPTTGSTPSSYTPYVNGSATTGTGTPSSYTISGLSAGTSYSVALASYITGGTFNPTSITGCSVWWDASDPYGNGTVPTNGTAINTWTDKSGSGYNATATVAATYTSSNKALNFTTGFYTSNYPANPTNESCFIVFNRSQTAQMIMIGSTVGGRQIATSNGSNFGFVSAGIAWGLLTGSTSVGTTYLGEAFLNSSNEYLTINGATSLAGPNTQTFNSGTLTNIGREGNPGSIQYQGYIMEIIFYNSYLSTTDRQNVEGYLAWKWSIQSSLPVAHPYYSAAPVGTTIYQNPNPVSLSTIFNPTLTTFTSSGTFTSTGKNYSILIVGGGGSGGYNGSGGGGGGGVVYFSSVFVPAGSVNVTVGAGGIGTSGNGNNGGNSSFGSYVALGGGCSFANGGCGGGANTATGGSSIQSAISGATYSGGFDGGGRNGGTGESSGGGGGAGGVGATSDTNGGNGGIGYQCSITGTATYYAGGGGGGKYPNGTVGLGGSGGGGKGGGNNAAGSDGTPNTGGGGGAGSTGGSAKLNTQSIKGGGYNGGSGIVIVYG